MHLDYPELRDMVARGRGPGKPRSQIRAVSVQKVMPPEGVEITPAVHRASSREGLEATFSPPALGQSLVGVA